MTHSYYLQILIDYLHQHPRWGIFAACAIAFIESFPVLGSIVPGTVTMTMVGAAMGSGVLPMPATLLWTIFGAILGDSSGYLLGRYYQDRLARIWPFASHPQWLISGKNFFSKHGGKSIFMGFYMGPIRSMVPLTAGMLNFTAWRFFSAIVPSACVWAALYTTPGFLLGKFALTLPPKLATELILFVLLGIISLWLLIWCINHVFTKIWVGIDYVFHRLWTCFYQHPWSRAVSALLKDKQNPLDHYQLLRLFFILILLILFITTVFSAMAKGVVTQFNEPIYFLLRSIRNETLTPVMISITLFSDKRVMWSASILIAAWLMRKKYFRTAYYLLGLVISTTASILLFKHEIPSVRPPEPNYPVATNSLPSGHTTLSIVLLIFLGALLSSALPAHRKKIPFYCITFIIILIALSRLYLGAHWFSDIIASLLLAAAYALIALLLYFRKPRPFIPATKLLTVILFSLGISWVINSIYAYSDMAKLYAHSYLPTVTVESNAWWDQTKKLLPFYRDNRLGKAVQAFNIQWADPLPGIKEELIAQGWQDHSSDASLSATIKAVADKSPLHYLSLFPKLYQNRPPAALLSFGNAPPFLVLQLWECNIILNNYTLNNNSPLWLGVVFYYKTPKNKKTANPIQSLIPFLKNNPKKLLLIPAKKQPAVLQKNHWDGRILLIK